MPRKKRPPETPPSADDPVLPGVNAAVEDHSRPDEGLLFPIVAIGASAGGLDAITELLKSLPSTTGMAFVVVQHLSPTHESVLSEILQRATRMPVEQVANNTAVQPDRVYVIPPGKNLVLGNGLLQLSPRTEERGQHRPVDHFMRSLAEEHGHRAIGVVLSGTANDGALGIQEIKAGGGVTFAQDASAEHSGMPRSAVATGAVDLVLAPGEIGRELGRIAQHPYVREGAQSAAVLQDAALNRVLGTLRRHTGVEFAGYKRNTITRRVKRRLLLHRIDGLAEYVSLLQSRPAEVDALFQDLLINVTSFFRDPDAFEALKTVVFPKLTEGRSRNEPVRIWALGCSTGEEAYSLAIAFNEYAEASGHAVAAQIFATDLNGPGIEKARAGIYSKAIAQDVSPERLRRYFVDIDGSYQIAKPIRDMCVFARQNVLSDPPFSRLDLVACRNMLIYLEPSLQQRVIPTLHYALRPEGFLWLGSSETIGTHRDLFHPVDVRHRIYEKRATPGVAIIPTLRRDVPPREAAAAFAAARREAAADPQRSVDRLLLERFAPPAVVLDANLDIVQFRGDTSPFVAPAPGKASLALPKMLREGLQVAVVGALQRARREHKPVLEKGLRMRANGESRDVDVEVVPLPPQDGAVPGFLVLFHAPGGREERKSRAPAAKGKRVAPASEMEVARMERELAATRDYLQSVIEQQESANEELQSANEEVQSANEELQSINEELETSKEEIQSSNEELATVNDELQNRNQQLALLNNDLVNLIASVHVAIVMLDRDLRIRRFTPAAERLFNLIPGDIGRPLGDIMFHLLTPDFVRVVTEVIEQATTTEREVRDRNGRWYSLRVRPYRTLENQIDGAVLMLVDIDTMKRAEQVLLDSDLRRDEFMAMLAHELRNPLSAIANSARLLEAGEDGGELAQARDIIERQSRHMTRMVDDLLDLARVKEGKIQPRLEPVELVASVRHAIEATAHQRDAAGIELIASYPSRPVWVRGDPMRLAQVVSNLLDNATKFTKRGGHIWVSVEVPAPTPAAVVRVRDDGIGIDAQTMPRIFDLFVQASEGQAGKRGGIGLGLTLARLLVGLHGGSIEATSPGEGRGAEFVVRLPLIEAPQQLGDSRAPRRIRRIAGPPRRILVVDDNLDSAESMRALLRMAGHEVRMVADGASAAPAAREMRAEVVLLDIGLPDMDGYEVARRLRADPELDGMLVIAVTGWGREADVQKGLQAGIDEHLTKPVDPDRLMELVAKGGEESEPGQRDEVISASRKKRGKR